MLNEEWSAMPIVNEELIIENSTLKHRSEARIIQHSTFNTQNSKAMKKKTWITLAKFLVNVLTAALTAMGTTACRSALM